MGDMSLTPKSRIEQKSSVDMIDKDLYAKLRSRVIFLLRGRLT